MSNNTLPQTSDIDPLVYISTMDRPGVLVMWSRMSPVTSVAYYQVLRSQTIDGDYFAVATLTTAITEWVDPDGHPNFFYKIVEIAPDNTTLYTSAPIVGEELLIKASLLYEVRELMRMPIYDEEVLLNRGRKSGRLTFGNWNCYTTPELRISSYDNEGTEDSFAVLDTITPITSTQVDSNGNPLQNYPDGLIYQLDWQGTVYFTTTAGEPVAIDKFDTVLCSYSVSLFTYSQLNAALNQALQAINSQPGAEKYRSVAQTPFYYDEAIICGATYYLLRQLLVQLSAREKRLLLQDPERDGYDAIASLRETIKLYEDEWKDFKKNLPIARYPTTLAVVTQPIQLPGGRSRMFRQLWVQNV